MKKIITSLGMIVFAAAIVVGGTGAFFSDTETSTGNVFTAGALDLKVDSEAHYNGMVCVENIEGEEPAYWWQPGLGFPNGVPADHYPQPGTPCFGTWAETDLGVGLHRFFNFDDIKPGDVGENTISLHVYNNDAWGCFLVNNVKDDDRTCTEPETESTDLQCSAVVPGTDLGANGLGELSESITFNAWLDQGATPGFQCGDPELGEDAGARCEEDSTEGDNVYQENEGPMFWQNETLGSVAAGPFDIKNVLAGAYTLADADDANGCDATGNTNYASCHGLAADGRMVGSATYYFGLAWNIPDTVGNEAQTDSLTADMIFEAVQHRNNPNFRCGGTDGGGLGCTEKADVMFVLDSSGSIDDTELPIVKNAAISFATALAPSADGIHIGVVDFDSDATLSQHLTDVIADINTAVNAIASGGNTNLGAAITTASTELSNPGDSHDRADGESPDYMVIITDGNPQDTAAATAAANAAKAAGTTVYVVGVGDGVDTAFLQGIASNPSLYFGSAQFADLQAILAGIADCDPVIVAPTAN